MEWAEPGVKVVYNKRKVQIHSFDTSFTLTVLGIPKTISVWLVSTEWFCGFTPIISHFDARFYSLELNECKFTPVINLLDAIYTPK